MGAWGDAAWDNDAAADWFGELFDKTGLAKRVEETLKQDPDEHHEEIRAATYVLVALGRVYIWPIADLDHHLELSINRLQHIKRMDIYQEAPEIIAAIDEEIATLRSRLKPQKG